MSISVPSAEAPDCVALITARGGSKRVPGKNVRDLAGRPLIAWTVAAALGAKMIRRTIVSTDSDEIATAAREAGAEVPFLRPPALSGDLSPHYDVVAHALDWIERDEGALPNFLCLLQPTSPLRTSADIDGTIGQMIATDADCAIAVSPARSHPAHLYRLAGNGLAEPYLPPAEGYQRSQDLEQLYQVNGAVYVLRPETFRQRDGVLSEHPALYIMPSERSIDIDEEWEFAIAEALMKRGAGG